MNELISNCSQSIPSTIDRDMVESEKQFLPYLSNPLFIETMSSYIFTAIDVIQYKLDLYCLIIGTSKIKFITAFFVKHDLRRVLKYIGLKIRIPH
jgi:hypothetical protein